MSAKFPNGGAGGGGAAPFFSQKSNICIGLTKNESFIVALYSNPTPKQLSSVILRFLKLLIRKTLTCNKRIFLPTCTFLYQFLWLCRVAALKSLPVHPFNALIFPILRDCLQSVCKIHQDVYHDLFVCS